MLKSTYYRLPLCAKLFLTTRSRPYVDDEQFINRPTNLGPTFKLRTVV